MKTALLFAGQGAQVPGMGKDLAAQFPTAQRLFQEANDILGYDLAGLCFNEPESELTKTEHAQPAIFLVSWIALALLRDRLPTLTFEAAAGLSLGEFTALAAVEAMTFEEGLKLVRRRGEFMSEACQKTRGGMAAIIGLEEQPLGEVCEKAGVELANLNCPGQIVISGESERLANACQAARAAGAKRALMLPVAGAYHSRLMESAKRKLEGALAAVSLRPPVAPVISNVTARPHGSPEETHRLLVEQMTSPVLWEQSMRYLLEAGFQRFIELGPGTTLSGFLKRIDRTADTFNVADAPSLKTAVQALVT